MTAPFDPADGSAAEAELLAATAQPALADRISEVSEAVSAVGTRALLVTTERQDATSVSVRVDGELDIATRGILADALADQLRRGRRYVRLDLSGLSFCDCAGLNVFVHAHHRFLAAHGTLVLTGVGPRIHRLLTITGLDDVLLCAAATPDPAASQLPPHDTDDQRSQQNRPEERPT